MIKNYIQVNHDIKFRCIKDTPNDNEWCWRAKVLLNSRNIEVEIDQEFHNNTEIDWKHVEQFIGFLQSDAPLTKLLEEGKARLLQLGLNLYEHKEEVKQWEMLFDQTIYYNGQSNNNSSKTSYSLVFNFMKDKKNNIIGDKYGMYLVEVEDQEIIDVQRIEC
ncbi:hypothetical protein K5X82_00705 [Halosquirtibacter xylanolyticus]|uniref:hypothetical protein n=1 Tax=Halosquirtibacter xylanolyticus TaxID=3374599 RepID=UPI00374A6BA3|nr:hypothetical protein K5X82_00705 [Prolixibacteraceae bacterium]